MKRRHFKDDETFRGFTKKQAKAMYEYLKEVGLRRSDNEDGGKEDFYKRILPDIETLMFDLHPDTVLHAGEIQRRLKAL